MTHRAVSLADHETHAEVRVFAAEGVPRALLPRRDRPRVAAAGVRAAVPHRAIACVRSLLLRRSQEHNPNKWQTELDGLHSTKVSIYD